MQCYECKVEKLYDEFVHQVSESCGHPSFLCLKCCISRIQQNGTCPECSVTLTSKDKQTIYRNYSVITQLDKFAIYEAISSSTNISASSSPSPSSGHIIVTKLSGEHYDVPFILSGSVISFMRQLEQLSGIPVDNQRILYNKKEVKAQDDNGRHFILGDYGFQNGSVAQLMNVMYNISNSSKLNRVVFDLYWGFPVHGKDFLDGTCIMVTNNNNVRVVDYKHKMSPCNSISHSGDIMDTTNKIGRHIINVSILQIPNVWKHVKGLYFVLSAYCCNNIAFFNKPNLKFYEQSNPTKPLASTNITNAGSARALLLCGVVRSNGGGWRVIEIGKQSAGNASDYSEIYRTIGSVLNQ